MTLEEYRNSAAIRELCKRNGQAKRIVRDLNWFMGKVQKMPSGCWEWIGVRNIYGYGFFQIFRQVNKVSRVERMWMAHRYSWFLHYGEITDGLWVLHKCDNPPCCNPEHLFLGTNKQNQRDSHDKDRGYFKVGQRHPHATISNETALRVKAMIRSGMGSTDIARQLGLKVYTVENIKYGQSFKWLGEEAVGS